MDIREEQYSYYNPHSSHDSAAAIELVHENSPEDSEGVTPIDES
jgi:hypothetical protein